MHAYGQMQESEAETEKDVKVHNIHARWYVLATKLDCCVNRFSRLNTNFRTVIAQCGLYTQ